jgi:excisionase family DNA binding protein
MTTPLLSINELAALLGVPAKTIRAWRCRGVGPRGMRLGRHVRYRLTDVETWLDQQADPQSAA